MKRREVVKAAMVAPLAFMPFSSDDGAKAALHALTTLQGQAQGVPYKPRYFKADEWKEVRLLVDMIIPRDERSGSATEAGVPEFMDWICNEYPSYSWMRDGLRWLDGFAYDTHSKAFANLTDGHRRELLDQIAWPAKAAPALHEGVNYFNRIRDFTASGFFSSQMGVKDLQYIGNAALPVWPGCPQPALDHLGVSY
jgi:gluconate 2-dehydrogenase gamma chain